MNTNKLKQFIKTKKFYTTNVTQPYKKTLFDRACSVYIIGFFTNVIGFGYFEYKLALQDEHIPKKRKMSYVINATWNGMMNGCLIGSIWPMLLPIVIFKNLE